MTRYLSQARELEKLAGADKVTARSKPCESPQTARSAARAGIPHARRLRQSTWCSRRSTPRARSSPSILDSRLPNWNRRCARTGLFAYDFQPTKVPVSIRPGILAARSPRKSKGEFIDYFIGDPAMCRLYLGYSKLDRRDGRRGIRKAMPAQRLKTFAHVLDFLRRHVRDPQRQGGGARRRRSGKAWTQIGGQIPEEGRGLLRTPADAGRRLAGQLLRLPGPHRAGPVQDYLLDPKRMKRFYIAIKRQGHQPRSGSSGVSRQHGHAAAHAAAAAGHRWPAAYSRRSRGLEATSSSIIRTAKYDGKLTRSPTRWKEPDDRAGSAFRTVPQGGGERAAEDSSWWLTDLDRYRTKPLEAATVDRLARDFSAYGAQYAYFSEIPTVSDATIVQYLERRGGDQQIRDNLRPRERSGNPSGPGRPVADPLPPPDHSGGAGRCRAGVGL